MRENPWHLRIPNAQHEQWFKNLVEFHELTAFWLKDLQIERPPHFLTRGLNKDLAENIWENIWMLDSLSKTPLEKLLDDTTPNDTLGRLEKTIWAVQTWTLNYILSEGLEKNQAALESLLEQSSWKAGKNCCEKRWRNLNKSKNQDLGTILLALHDSPFAGFPHQNSFLVKRSTHHEIQLDLLTCPHQLSLSDNKNTLDSLCRQQTQWSRGFAFAINPAISVEHTINSPRCTQRWFIG